MSATVQAPVVPAAATVPPVAPVKIGVPSSATTWGAILVTVLIFGAYFAFIAISVQLKLSDLANSLAEVAKQGVTFALGYWIGGSRGSTDKTAALQPPTPGV